MSWSFQGHLKCARSLTNFCQNVYVQHFSVHVHAAVHLRFGFRPEQIYSERPEFAVQPFTSLTATFLN